MHEKRFNWTSKGCARELNRRCLIVNHLMPPFSDLLLLSLCGDGYFLSSELSHSSSTVLSTSVS